MSFRHLFVVVALLALSASAGCSGCAPNPADPPGVTCSDGAKNGVETDTDCGGATCVAQGRTCAIGESCLAAADCNSGFCNGSNVCAMPTCVDGAKNGAETDVDCGGLTCVGQAKTCVNGKSCLLAADCSSGYCDTTYHCADACGGTGASCTSGSQCCQGNCAGTTSKSCQPPSTCTGTGGGCASGATCCSGYCPSTSCVEPCRDTGSNCGADTECCTGTCSGTPTKTCQPPGGCTATGGGCSTGATCCSGLCAGSCVEPCTRNDQSCNFDSDCCTGYCDPAEKRCGVRPACILTDDTAKACSLDSQCCEGYCNPVEHFCRTPISCGDAGGACLVGGDCCSSSCNQTTHTCNSQNPFCKAPGAACDDDIRCCSLSCAGGICAGGACKQAGTECTTGSECCTGLCSGTPKKSCQLLPGGSCKTLGDSCTLATDCCSTNCRGGACMPAYSCQAANDICYGDDDCCSGMCTAVAPAAGRCVLPSGGCNQDGNPCSGASNCCTRLCVDMGGGVTVCKPASGCRMTGDNCDQTQACCGGSPDLLRPDGYKIFCDTAGPPSKDPSPPRYDTSSTDDYRCGGGTSCNPPGNICGAAGDPASQNCCNGKKDVCKRDSLGISRCFGGCRFENGNGCTDAQCPNGYGWQYDPPCCIEAGAGTANVCQFRDQCCGGVPCVPSPVDGVLRCTAPTCTPLHGECAGGDDPSCCVDTTCTFNGSIFTCEVPTSCVENGGACTVASDCCSSNCTGGRCAPPCVRTGGVCTLDECCSGLTCFRDPPTASSGVCQPVSTCAQHGAGCDASNPCCQAADQCLDGTCQAPPTCKDQYASCATTDTCCSTPAGLTCMEPSGAACTAGSTSCSCDNCSGASGLCNPSASPSGCCLGLACNGSGSTGTCATCALLGSNCTSDAGCCSPLRCSDANGYDTDCATPGACTCNSCIPVGEACSVTNSGCCGIASCARMDGEARVDCAEGDLDCFCIENG